LVTPQLRAGSRDTFAQPGGVRAFVDQLLQQVLPERVGVTLAFDRLEGVTLVAHSAGHAGLAHALDDHELAERVRNVVLFDTAPARTANHIAWLRADPERRHLVIAHTDWADAEREADALVAAARRIPGANAVVVSPAEFVPALAHHSVVATRVAVPHGWVPWIYFPKVLAALHLPPREFAHDAPDEQEFSFANAPPAETPLRAGAVISGDLDDRDARTRDGSAVDVYGLDLHAGDAVDIDVRGLRSRSDPAVPLDVIAALFDGPNEVARDDDRAGGLGSRITYRATHDGHYVLRVSSYGAYLRSGPYRVRVAGHTDGM
jgi:hypothetical protein